MGRLWIWIGVIAIAVIVAIAPFTGSSVECFDSSDPDASYCTSVPSIGWPAAWVLAGICTFAAGFALYRIIMLRRR
ncbi:hypothetical protein L2X99_02340 [Microbacterium sp. KUDC0406]|uniref:hypothetical protein n=1 Tax=Microbacterium sp. KUDC0406 TaxID=2909588 RepID=UPI001F1A8942|nr:hypothetical protein [Microbacterium sp. KUDC0406]UJP10544.1 hypothetical protein L2X99_02340 [Microbacterium sp. KUDC0406]